jgi:hypothetical protein
MMLLALLFAMTAPQEVPIYNDGQTALDQMTSDLNAHLARCGTRARFYIPKGKKLGDAKAVIDKAATAEQIACAKGVVSWLMTWDEAAKAGIVK